MRLIFPMMGLLLLVYACTDGEGGFGPGGIYNPGGGGTPGDDDTGAVDSADLPDSQDSADTADTFGKDCALSLGATACDLRLRTQSGEDWTLWEARPGPVVLLIGHAYDDSMQRDSTNLKAATEGLVTLAAPVLLDNLYKQSASAQDAAAWSTQYGLTLSFADPYNEARSAWFQTSQAQTWVMDKDLVIVDIVYGTWDPEDLRATLEALQE